MLEEQIYNENYHEQHYYKVPNDPSSFVFEGMCCAVHSAMNDDLSLNLEAVEPVAKHLVKNHVNGVFVCGTTGESMLLSVDERKAVILLLGIDVQLAEKWIEVGHRYGLCVIIHIGHEVLSVAQDLAKHSYVGFFHIYLLFFIGKRC